MKKIKLKLNELTNPELLSVETMKSIQGGTSHCADQCFVENQLGFCADVDPVICECQVPGGYASTIDCYN